MGRKPYDPIAEAKKIAESMGLTLELPDTTTLEAARREADSVLLYIENPNAFREAECRECRRYFATNYGSVACCSDNCRRAGLRKIGIEWNPTKTQAERWAGNIPLVVPPDALPLAKKVLELTQ